MAKQATGVFSTRKFENANRYLIAVKIGGVDFTSDGDYTKAQATAKVKALNRSGVGYVARYEAFNEANR